MLSQVEEALDLILSQILAQVLLIPSIVLDSTDLAVCIGVVIKLLIPSQAEEASDFILFQAVEHADLMFSH